jgi:hypothetical protein
MLHKETVEPATLGLITSLQADPALHDFSLVGGTALSLQIGHRISLDIDLFTRHPFDAQVLADHLEKRYGFALQLIHHYTLKGFINSIFVDIIRHDYDLVNPPITEEGITMLSKADIAAFKLNAISGNGTRAKDFVDIYFLLKEYSLDEIIGFYKQKYSSRNEFHALKSLGYFEDIVESDWPNLVLEKDLTLPRIKHVIRQHLDDFLKQKLNN